MMNNYENKFRYEKKYIISNKDAFVLKDRLNQFLDPDIFGDDYNTYRVTTLYLDDRKQTKFTDKVNGLQQDGKYRIRMYKDDASRLVLEKKTKTNDLCKKIRCELTFEQYRAIYTRQNIEILLEPNIKLLHEVYSKIRAYNLFPRIVVDYLRQAYEYKHGDVRITFDREIKAGMHNLDLTKKSFDYLSSFDNNKTIMEVKYPYALPSIINSIINIDETQHLAISKYVMCADCDNKYGGNLFNGQHTIIPRSIK